MLDLILVLCLVLILFGALALSALVIIALADNYARRNPVSARRLARRLNKILGVQP